MDIKNTIISAEVVIESLITLIKNEGVDISSIQFSIGNKEKGTESADMSFESLINLTLSWLNEAKNQAIPEGFVLVKDKPVAYMVQNKFWKGGFEVKLSSEMPEPEFEGDSYDIEIPLYAIEPQESANDSR